MFRKATIGLALLSTTAVGQQISPELATMKACEGGYGPLVSEISIAIPLKGSENEAEIGQSIVSSLQGKVMQAALTLPHDIRFSGSYLGARYEVVIPAGKLRPIYSNRGYAYTNDMATFKYDRDSKPRHEIGRPDVSVSIDPNNTSALIGYVNFGMSTKASTIEDTAMSSEKCLLLGTTGFRRELLYSGVSKGTVSIQYREFMNDMARPAFSQELKYDLADGSEIGYKGARFQIIKATNTSIRYKVLKPLD